MRRRKFTVTARALLVASCHRVPPHALSWKAVCFAVFFRPGLKPGHQGKALVPCQGRAAREKGRRALSWCTAGCQRARPPSEHPGSRCSESKALCVPPVPGMRHGTGYCALHVVAGHASAAVTERLLRLSGF